MPSPMGRVSLAKGTCPPRSRPQPTARTRGEAFTGSFLLSTGRALCAPLSCKVATGWLFALGLERAWLWCGLSPISPLPHGVWAGAALVFLAQNSKEAKNSKLFETAFQVIKVEGWNKFYVTVSQLDL